MSHQKMSKQKELEIQRKLALENFKLRSLAEAETASIQIAEEIKAILRKHGASLAEWNENLYIVPPGFKVYSEWDSVIGVEHKPSNTGLKVQQYDCEHRIVKPFPEDLQPKR